MVLALLSSCFVCFVCVWAGGGLGNILNTCFHCIFLEFYIFIFNTSYQPWYVTISKWHEHTGHLKCFVLFLNLKGTPAQHLLLDEYLELSPRSNVLAKKTTLIMNDCCKALLCLFVKIYLPGEKCVQSRHVDNLPGSVCLDGYEFRLEPGCWGTTPALYTSRNFEFSECQFINFLSST